MQKGAEQRYDSLVLEIYRLKGWRLGENKQEELVEIFSEYIYKYLPDKELLKLAKANNNKYVFSFQFMVSSILGDMAVQLITTTMLNIMKQSKDWGDFQSKVKKEEPKDMTDFDKILEGIMLVPKEEDKKDKKKKK